MIHLCLKSEYIHKLREKTRKQNFSSGYSQCDEMKKLQATFNNKSKLVRILVITFLNHLRVSYNIC